MCCVCVCIKVHWFRHPCQMTTKSDAALSNVTGIELSLFPSRNIRDRVWHFSAINDVRRQRQDGHSSPVLSTFRNDNAPLGHPVGQVIPRNPRARDFTRFHRSRALQTTEMLEDRYFTSACPYWQYCRKCVELFSGESTDSVVSDGYWIIWHSH